MKARIDEGVRHAAYRIIEGKGATYHGIGAGIARIVDAVRDDEGAVLTLSNVENRTENLEGLSFSLPRVIDAGGIVATIDPSLSPEEHQALLRSTGILREAASELKYWDDWDGWKVLNGRLGNSIELIGDDLFVTNIQYIERGIHENCANAVLIKLNQIGSLRETMEAIRILK